MKDGGWVPVDKRLTNLLPKGREYTFLEAYISLRIDLDSGAEVSINGYARMWSWSRNKVRYFVEGLRTGKGHAVDTQRTGKGHEIRLFFKELEDRTDSRGTVEGQSRDRQGTITINKEEKEKERPKRFTPPSVLDVADYMSEIGYKGDAQNFVDSNTAKGWVIGKLKTPAKDWKAMVRTWHGNDKKNRPQEVPTPERGTPEYTAALQKRLAL